MTSVGLELIEDPTNNGSSVPTTLKSYAHTEESMSRQGEYDREDEDGDSADDEEDEGEGQEDDGDEWFVESSNRTVLEGTFTLGEFNVQSV